MVAKSFAFNDLSLPLVVFLWCHLIYSVEIHFGFCVFFHPHRHGYGKAADEDETRRG